MSCSCMHDSNRGTPSKCSLVAVGSFCAVNSNMCTACMLHMPSGFLVARKPSFSHLRENINASRPSHFGINTNKPVDMRWTAFQECINQQQSCQPRWVISCFKLLVCTSIKALTSRFKKIFSQYSGGTRPPFIGCMKTYVEQGRKKRLLCQ